MKTTFENKSLLLSFLACCLLFCFSSCSHITDAQITAFEKSIDKLEKQLEMLEESDRAYTKEQTKRIANLKGRYHRLLLKIELYTLANEIFDTTEGESVLEYIRGVLLGKVPSQE